MSIIFVVPVQSFEHGLTLVDAQAIQKKAKEFDHRFKVNVAKKVLVTSGVISGSVGGVVLYRNRKETQKTDIHRERHFRGTVSDIFKTSIALAVAQGMCSALSSTASKIKDFYSTSLSRNRFSFLHFATRVQIMFEHVRRSISTFDDSLYDVKRNFITNDESFLENIRKEIVENYREFTYSSVDLCGFMIAQTKRKRPEKEGFVCFGINRLMTYQNQCTQNLMADINERDDFEISLETQKMIIRLGQVWDEFLEKYTHVVPQT